MGLQRLKKRASWSRCNVVCRLYYIILTCQEARRCISGRWISLVGLFKDLYFLSYVCECLFACMYVYMCMHCLWRPRRGHWILWNWYYRWLWTIIWVLGCLQEQPVLQTEEPSLQPNGWSSYNDMLQRKGSKGQAVCHLGTGGCRSVLWVFLFQ